MTQPGPDRRVESYIDLPYAISPNAFTSRRLISVSPSQRRFPDPAPFLIHPSGEPPIAPQGGDGTGVVLYLRLWRWPPLKQARGGAIGLAMLATLKATLVVEG